MEVLGNKEGSFFSLSCDWCDAKTGYLYIIEEDGKRYEICTSCKALDSLEKEGKDGIASGLRKMFGHYKKEDK